MISTIAGGYGWSREEILDCYVDELKFYAKEIAKEKVNESIMIAQASANAQSKKPNDYIKQLKNIVRSFEPPSDVVDRDAINKLKNIFKRNV